MKPKEKERRLEDFCKLYRSNSNNFKIQQLPYYLPFFTKQIKKEDQSQYQQHFRVYHPGQVVLVKFGVSIGAELCGTHFAIVLNQKDAEYKKILTVVPISSKDHKGYLPLGTEIAQTMTRVGLETNELLEKEVEKYGKEIDALKKFDHFSPVFTAEEATKLLGAGIRKNDIKNLTIVAFGDNSKAKTIIRKIKKIKSFTHYPTIYQLYRFLSECLAEIDKLYKHYNQLRYGVQQSLHFAMKTKKHLKPSFAITSNIKTISKLRLIDYYDVSVSERIIISNNLLQQIKNQLDI